jgi:signal transduction histidine kinase
LELLVDALREPIALIDADEATIISNEAYRRLLEQNVLRASAAELGGQPLEKRVAAGERFHVQFGVLARGGRRRWFEAYGTPMPAELGASGGILVVHDTTDLSLRRLQEEFVATVAHELRTPLTALRGYLGLLRRSGSPAAGSGNDGEPRLLHLAEEQAERLGRLVDELFDVTRANTGRLDVHPEPVSLRAVVVSTVEIAQSLSPQRIEVDGLDESDVEVEVDAQRMQQVLLNILVNAQRHAASAPTVALRVRRQRRHLIIEIEDHGPGMRDEIRERLFSRFHVDPSSPGRGLGLGLYISGQIVKAHGGTIEADSAPGEGTTFTIRLPLSASGD